MPVTVTDSLTGLGADLRPVFDERFGFGGAASTFAAGKALGAGCKISSRNATPYLRRPFPLRASGDTSNVNDTAFRPTTGGRINRASNSPAPVSEIGTLCVSPSTTIVIGD